MSEQKVEFDHYRTTHEVLRHHEALNQVIQFRMRPLDFFEGYRQVFARRIQEGAKIDRTVATSYRQAMTEYRWYQLGQPRYRVYENMALALAKISIDIDAGHLRLPFPVISIEVPKNCLREHDDAPYLRGMLISYKKRNEPDKGSPETLIRYNNSGRDTITHHSELPEDTNDVMTVDFDFGDEMITDPLTNVRGPNACKPFVVFDIDPGKTIAERFDLMPQIPPPDDGYMPSPDFQKACLRIAVGVAFFAIHDHEVIERYLPKSFVERKVRANASKSKKQLQRLQSKIKNMGLAHTFDVGRELVIPSRRDASDHAPSNGDTGRHLRWSHVRSGHMAWQPYGPRDNPKYKLIFRPFTVVRPDLPMKPQTPHAVK